MKTGMKVVMKVRLVGWMLAAVCGSASLAWTQPPPERGPDRVREGGPEGEVGVRGDREAIVTRLERRLSEIEREKERVSQALERLRQGESPEEVRRALAPEGGEVPRGRVGERPRDRRGPGGPGRGEGFGGRLGDRRPGMDGPGPDRGEMDGPPMERGPMEREMEAGPLSLEDRERLMAVLREHMPAMAQVVEHVPEEGRERMLRRIAPRVREAMALKERDPKLFELKASELRGGIAVMAAARSARELMRREHDGEADIGVKRDGAKKALREAMAAQFDTRAELQRHEVELLSSRLEALKERVSKQASERDARIDEMVRRVMEGGEAPPGGGR